MREFSINIQSCLEEKKHTNHDITLYFVLEGKYAITESETEYHLLENDMILVNANRPYSIRTVQEGVFCVFRLSYATICSLLGVDFVIFKCNSVIENGQKYSTLRSILQNLLVEYVADEKQRVFKFRELYDSLADILVTEFRVNDYLILKKQREYDRRLSIIMNYIQTNYDQTVTLSELSEKLYMSVSAVSRFFTKAVGESFVQYVRRFRLQMVAEELVQTDRAITKIAMENGFSAPSAMNKDFKAAYGMSPGEYRTKMRGVQKNNPQILPEKLKQSVALNAQKAQKNERMQLRIDTAESQYFRHWHNRIMNVGWASMLELAEVQKQILMLKEELGMSYVRIWNLRSEELLSVNPKTHAYNWRRLDEILDFCVENRLKLHLDLGQRTKLARASERRLIYSDENGYEFTSRSEWEFYLEEFMKHIASRYGRHIVKNWIFEFSFFLNGKPYYAAQDYRSKIVWENGYRTIKRIVPGAKVAGPGLMVTGDAEFMNQIIREFLDTDCLPDIFTAFHFPYESAGGMDQLKKIVSVNFLSSQIELVRSILSACGYKGKYYITDWNNSLANRNYVQDSCFRGTFILKNVLENFEKVDEMGFWYATDLLNVYYDSDAILSGSGGMLTRNGICKPAFFAFQFLASMGQMLVQKGENYLVTKSGDFDFQILCFNDKNLGYYYYQKDEDFYKPDELNQLFQNRDFLEFDLTLEHLKPDTEYVIRQKVVNEKHGSILDAWVAFGCEKELTSREIHYLKQTTVPKMYMERVFCEKGTLQMHLSLLPHEIRWISITGT